MSTEVPKDAPAANQEKEMNKEEAPVDNGQTKEEPAAGEEQPAAKQEPTPKPTVHKTDYEKDVVYLYQFTRTPSLPSISPYCLKLETWLRLAEIKYENVDHKAKFRSKKGQLPFVELNGEEIADSTIIIKELSEKFNKDMDAGLTPEQRILSHAMVSMTENHLSWVILWYRAKYPDNMIKGYQVNLQNALNTRIPTPFLNFCFKFTFGRKGMKKAKAHGIGVHSQEEILEFGKTDMRVLSDLLADKPFFFGDEPTLLDVVVFANLAQLHFINKDVAHPLRDALDELFPNLVALVARLKERAFRDWDEMCSTLDLNTHLPKPPKEVKETKDEVQPEKQAEDGEKGKDVEKEKEAEKEPEEKADKEEEKEKEK